MELFSFIANIHLIQAICLLIGLGLVLFEIFDPGFGVPGISGLILLVVGILLTARNLFEGIVMFIILIIILTIAVFLAIRSATKGRLSRTLVLSDSLNTQSGYVGTKDMTSFEGKEGTSLTILRPSGTANFDGVKLDVVTEGEFIPKNTSIKVIEVSGRRIVVKSINEKV